MSAPASSDLLTRLAARWLADDPTTQVLHVSWQWQPKWPAGLLVLTLIAAWLLVTATHRSRRLDLPGRWRIVLGLLRAAIVAVPVLVLMQPSVMARLERQEPRTLAVLVDRSASMSVADGLEPEPTSRWQRALDTLVPTLSTATGGDTSDRAARRRKHPIPVGPSVEVYLFGEALEPVELGQLDAPEHTASAPRTAIGDALQQVRSRLSGRPTAGILLLSDGGENASAGPAAPLRAARDLARDGIRIDTCLAGNEHPRRLAVHATADAPFAFADDPVSLQVRIEHEGFADELVTATLHDGDRVLARRDVVLPADDQPAIERFDVTPEKPGRSRYRVELTPLPGELTTRDNEAVAEVQVIDQPIRLLYVERWPRWQYRFLRNALRRDHRFAATLVMLSEDPATPAAERQTAAFPATAEELDAFDVMVIGDLAPQDLAPEQWQWVHDHVTDDGAGAVFIAGPVHMPASFLDNPVAPLLPFERVVTVSEEDAEAFRPVVTALGAYHPVMRLGFGDDLERAWRSLPALYWHAGLADLKPGAAVLAERPADAGREPGPLIVLQRAGRGSVLFVATDETWRWRYRTGNRYFYGFWAHALQHVAMPHRVGQFRTVRIETAGGALTPGVPAQVTVAFEPGSAPDEVDPDSAVILVAEHVEGGAPESFALRRTADSPYLYEGRIRLPRPGAYRLFVEGRDDQGDAAIEVAAASELGAELADPAVHPDLLRQIADATGGESVRLEALPELVSRLDLAPLRYRWSQRIPLWDGWLMLGVLAALLTAEWVLRKWKYLP